MLKNMEARPGADELKIEEPPRLQSVLHNPEKLTAESSDRDKLEAVHRQIDQISEDEIPEEHLPVPELTGEHLRVLGIDTPHHRDRGLFGWVLNWKERAEVEKREKARTDFEKFKLEALEYIKRAGDNGGITHEQQLTAISGIGNQYPIAQKIRESVPKVSSAQSAYKEVLACLAGLSGVDDDIAWKKRDEMLDFINQYKSDKPAIGKFISALSKSLGSLGGKKAEELRNKLRELGAPKNDILLSYVGVDTDVAWE